MRYIILLTLVLCGNVYASPEVAHLKCWIRTVEGEYRIVNYKFEADTLKQASDPAQFAAGLTGEMIFKLDGTSEVKIDSATECVPLDDNFSNSTARQVDVATPQ